MTKKTKYRVFGVALGLILGFVALIGIFNLIKPPKPAVSVITTEGVINEIHKLNRLTTAGYSIDTVITAQKDGTWYKLWQDEQKGLFVAKGRVLAGVDLSKLTAENVKVSHDAQTDPAVPPTAQIDIQLPSSEVFEVFLDEIAVYDWQTGLFGVVDNDPEILKQAQTQAKATILAKACEGKIMQLALDNAKEQVQGLFMLTGARVIVHSDKAGQCKIESTTHSP